MQKLERVKSGSFDNAFFSELRTSPTLLNFYVSPSTKRSISESVVECYIYDLFVIMNLASPASFNLYNARFKGRTHFERPRFSMSSNIFEIAALRSRDGHWPSINDLSLADVANWYKLARGELSMVPATRMQRVIFALLHLAKIDISPSQVIWLFYALESLFDTKPGENFRSLVQRIELLLTADRAESKRLRSKMRELYDLRSAFVHGGLKVIHPLHNEVLDKSVDVEASRLMTAIDFGCQLLVASLQEVIRRGWIEPIFQEILCQPA